MYGYTVRVNINIIVAHCHHMLVSNISKTKKETVCVANVRKSIPHMYGLLLMCQRKGYYHYIQRNYIPCPTVKPQCLNYFCKNVKELQFVAIGGSDR